MSASHFQKVIHFNVQFGVLENGMIQSNPSVFQENDSVVQHSLRLIDEEVKELHHAIQEKDYTETADALTDILYVVYGMGARLGIDLDKTFELVHQNNMSKICASKEEAEETVQYYQEQREKLGYDSPSYRLAPNQKNYVVFNASTKKVLKSIKWKPVDLSPVLS